MASASKPQVDAAINHLECKANLIWNIPDFYSWAVKREWPKNDLSNLKDSPTYRIKFGYNTMKFSISIRKQMRNKYSVDFLLRNVGFEDVTVQFSMTAADTSGQLFEENHEKCVLEKGKSLGCNDIDVCQPSHTALQNSGLEIKCALTIYSLEISKLDNSVEIPTLNDDLRAVLTDAAISDFKIICEKETYPCHKAVLASRSNVFK